MALPKTSSVSDTVLPIVPKKSSRMPAVLRNKKAVVGLSIIAIFVLVAVFAPLIAPHSPTAEQFTPGQAPSAVHWLGTNSLGQGVFSQVIWGTRVSLIVAFAAGFLATFLSVLVGIGAGYARGNADAVLSLVTNVFLVIPTLPLVIVLSAYLHLEGQLPIILVIGLTSWAWGARSLRSQALSIAQREYILEARLVGQSWWSIIFGEMLPNMASLVVSSLLFATINALLTEAGLDFLGLGNVNVTSWGTMLYWAQNSEALINGYWWWFLPPGIAIALFGGALALVNFSIDEITNPRLRIYKIMKRKGTASS